jgi:hypothetical protein
MRFFVLFFFHESLDPDECLEIFSNFVLTRLRIFMKKRKLTVNNPRKFRIFHGLFGGKACLSTG